MANYVLDMKNYAEALKAEVGLVKRKLCFDMFRRIILRSPVGNPSLWKNPPKDLQGYVGGRFRGNWQVAIGNVPQGTLDIEDASGTATISAVDAKLRNVEAGDVVYFVNNLPYANRLEFGWSSQAPNGMVRVTLEEVDTMMKEAIQKAAAESQKL